MMAAKTMEEEKQLIKRALSTALVEGAIWQPIACHWFQQWKNYVDFDGSPSVESRSKEVIDSQYPGEIDNSSLQGSFGDEMKRGSVEGRDYILLPTVNANFLFEKYGGGPQFPRKVLNVGSTYNPICQVNLYPIRIEAYHCDKNQLEPVQDESRFVRRYFSKNLPLNQVVDDLKKQFRLTDSAMMIRYWLKDDPPETSTSPNRPGRMLTCDIVDFVHSSNGNDGCHWRYVRHDRTRPIQEILGDKECIELIIETVNLRNPKDSDWPRYQQLEAWKDGLQINDLVDCKDNCGKFYEAVIKGIQNTSPVGIAVHFKGWDVDMDEVIPPNQIHHRIQPLHSETKDRNKWEEGQEIEVRVSKDEEKGRWQKATIINIDPKTEKIQIRYVSVVESVVVATAAAMETDEMKEGPSNTATVANTSGVQIEWHDLYSDALCPLYTHLIAPKSTTLTTTSSSSTGGGYGGYGYGVSSLYGNNNNSYLYGDKHTKGSPPVIGAVGLQNLGNTCFMNSILQCLSNTQPLTEIFLGQLTATGSSSEQQQQQVAIYKEQINYDNPLGHNGKIATTYGKLMKEMWSGAYTKIVPREFKNIIGEFRPSFAGYDQQDSQELMNCVLDGLHEDLNRIAKKPYMKKMESKGRSDDLIASESWRRFLQRNDSLIVERCFGQQKSHVTCTSCGKESVTFEEYLALSLPIPVKNTRVIDVVIQLLPYAMRRPFKFPLEVELTTSMSQCKKILIDKLIEYKLLFLPNSSSSISAGREMMNTSSEESSYEMIDKDDLLTSSHTTADHQEYDFLTTNSSSNGSSNGQPKKQRLTPPIPSPAAAAMVVIYDAYHFHFGTMFGTQPTTVSKKYSTTGAKNVAIAAFVSKMDTMIAFQLEYPLAEFKSATSSMPYSYYNNNNYINKKEEPAVEEGDKAVVYQGFDFNVATKQHERLELLTYPTRFAFPTAGPVITTNAMLHLKIREVLQRYLVPSNPVAAALLANSSDNSAAVWPYDLVVTTMYGSMIHRKIEVNDDIFVEIKENMELVVAVWHNQAISEGVVDIEQGRSLESIENLLSQFNTTSGNGSNLDDSKEDGEVAMEVDEGGAGVDGIGGEDEMEEEEDDEDGTAIVTKRKTTVAKKPTSTASTTLLPPLVKPLKKPGVNIDIYDCLDKYIEREQLADSETLYCSSCKQMLAPIKKMDVWTSPDVLILHLKRFQFMSGTYTVIREKINDFIDFPIEGLDLRKYVIGPQSMAAPPIYDLYAVSHHMGGLGGGHYTATCKNFVNNQWYNFNDSSVSPTDPSSAVSQSAYVLFYKRRTGALKWAGMVPHPVGLPDEEDE